MKLSVLAITALLAIQGVIAPAQAQSRCWWDRGVMYCSDDRDVRRDRYERRDRYDNRDERRRDDFYDDINQIYREVLGRNADWDGLRTYARALERGRSLRDIRQEIAYSSEARERINQLYREVLGRNVDSRGLRTYTDRLASSWSLRDIRRDLERSQEARNRDGNPRQGRNNRGREDRREFARSQEARERINQLYREVLGRDADPSGLRTYTNRLADGWSFEDIRRDLARSDEARRRR